MQIMPAYHKQRPGYRESPATTHESIAGRRLRRSVALPGDDDHFLQLPFSVRLQHRIALLVHNLHLEFVIFPVRRSRRREANRVLAPQKFGYCVEDSVHLALEPRKPSVPARQLRKCSELIFRLKVADAISSRASHLLLLSHAD